MGNPVCCAAGLAVLDIIRDEKLQQNAARVGSYFLEQLQMLAQRHPLIGNVRGSGLFLGVEFVRDLQTLEAATEETSEICSRMKDDHQILMSIGGPFDNV